MRLFLRATTVVALALVWSTFSLPAAGAEPPSGVLRLVSRSELDALASDTLATWSSKPTSPNGPVIRIESPIHNRTYRGPFAIKVEFLPGPMGYEVDISSLRLEYKKAWGIDITDRIREFIKGSRIDVAESELPRGRHTVEVQISDVAKNFSRQIFTVIIK